MSMTMQMLWEEARAQDNKSEAEEIAYLAGRLAELLDKAPADFEVEGHDINGDPDKGFYGIVQTLGDVKEAAESYRPTASAQPFGKELGTWATSNGKAV